ncbi:hypothetical protein A2Z67_00915 [Candidatus Woesebacteria bacterium RBG_13_36_22]|uniref:CMP/dCMP-type deaminase domain-containing protein n=1 Tax=Candidatus Woesebacteria bacterium RBG_13_36_22 TaxID=1802478 RepID=A0A1F7WZK9_9BACT|nr:MAG: hypothetical protein A2Z67_00915 [Candidatus Woesebacteria bacterium RBG_13_36_22]
MRKYEYYLGIAKKVSEASKCLRSHFGAIVVKDDMIIGTGYNGPARGVPHCNPCRRADYDHGMGYEKCIAIHAEVNAIIQSGGRRGCLGGTLYMGSHTGSHSKNYNPQMGDFCCPNCTRTIINSGIEWVIQEGENGVPELYHIPQLVKEGRLGE